MVKVIMGHKGEGKTKKLIELINIALEEEHGDVVCIEKNATLTFSIPYRARLVKLSEFDDSRGFDFLRGVISGLQAGNYDITHIFIDNLYKLTVDDSIQETEKFLAWCENFSSKEGVKFTMTISADVNIATDEIKKYF